MWEVILDALLDSLKVLAIIIVFYVLLSFVEKYLADKLVKHKKISPLLGAIFGLVPQCGFSVIAADLYLKQHITMGTIVAVFIACSDEALPIFLSSGDKIIMSLPLLIVKFTVGFIVGFLIDVINTKSKKCVEKHYEHCEHKQEVHVGCCKHIIEEEEQESNWHKYLWHPLIHSLKIFAYILVINIIFGLLTYYIGETAIREFLTANQYLTPLYAVLIGLIPNCVSSVLLSNLYLAGNITFGSCIAGLICNAGLGFVFLFKNKNNIKNNLIILFIVTMTGLIVGYAINLIFGFAI